MLKENANTESKTYYDLIMQNSFKKNSSLNPSRDPKGSNHNSSPASSQNLVDPKAFRDIGIRVTGA